MCITTSTELLKNLASTLDQVADDHTPVLITREGGKPAAVRISLEDYTSMEETNDLLRSPKNREGLLASIAELDAGLGVVRGLEE